MQSIVELVADRHFVVFGADEMYSLAMAANHFVVIRAFLTLYPGLRIRAQGGCHHQCSFEYHHAQHHSNERQHLRI